MDQPTIALNLDNVGPSSNANTFVTDDKKKFLTDDWDEPSPDATASIGRKEKKEQVVAMRSAHRGKKIPRSKANKKGYLRSIFRCQRSALYSGD